MPGVAGLIARGPDGAPAPLRRQWLEEMLRLMSHRPWFRQSLGEAGPMTIGTCGPGTLNPDGLPIRSAGGTVAGLFFGVLERTGPNGDGQAMADRVEAMGTEAVARLPGSYVTAWYDSRRGHAFVATDRLGTRPCYWTRLDDGTVAFSSELKAFLALPGFRRTLDRRGVAEFLFGGYLWRDRTLLEDAQALLPGSLLVVAEGQVRQSQYWDFDAVPQSPTGFEESAREGAELLRAAILGSLRPGGRTGLLLTGGLDSRVIANVAATAGVRLPTMTSGSGKDRESRTAMAVARRLKLQHTLFPISPDYLVDHGPGGIWYADGMLRPGHLHFIEAVERMHEHCDIVLSGYLGGPYLGGVDAPPAAVRTLSPLAMAERIYRPPHRSLLTALANGRGNGWHEARQEIVADVADSVRPDRPVHDEMLRLWHLGDQIRFILQLSATFVAHAGDVLYPFSDSALIDFVRMQPPEHLEGGRLYAAIAEHLCPDTRDIPVYSATFGFVPTPIGQTPARWRLRKRRAQRAAAFYVTRLSGGRISRRTPDGYTDYAHWFRTVPRLREWMWRVLTHPRTLNRGIISREGVERLLKEQHSRGYHFDTLANLIGVEYFCRYFLDGDPPPGVAEGVAGETVP